MIGAHCEGWHASPGSEEFDEQRGRTRLRSRQDGTEPDIPQGWLLPYRVKPELVSSPARVKHVPPLAFSSGGSSGSGRIVLVSPWNEKCSPPARRAGLRQAASGVLDLLGRARGLCAAMAR